MHCCAMMSWSDKACSFSDCRMWSTGPSWHEAACQDVHPTTGSAAWELDERLAPGFCLLQPLDVPDAWSRTTVSDWNPADHVRPRCTNQP